MYRKDTNKLPKYNPERVITEMMGELIMDLLTAGCRQDKERAYRNLERAGIDRKTADMMAAESTGRYISKMTALSSRSIARPGRISSSPSSGTTKGR